MFSWPAIYEEEGLFFNFQPQYCEQLENYDLTRRNGCIQLKRINIAN